MWHRLVESRRATFGLNLLLIFGTPVLLHVFAGMNRFSDGAVWYWAYAVVASLGVWLLLTGLRASNGTDQRG